MVVAGLKPSTQRPAPSQESVPSQTPPLEMPSQIVVTAWKPSAGQAPVSPVQLSATSHCPAEARQMVVAGLKPSTQWPAPSQESVPSQFSNDATPTQIYALSRHPAVGISPVSPVQLSATSH